MALNLCGRFYLSARRLMIVESDKGNSESAVVVVQIPSSSCISSDHIQDIQIQDKVALMRKVLL